MKRVTVVLLASLLILGACKKDETPETPAQEEESEPNGAAASTGTLELEFVATASGNAFGINQEFNNISGYRIKAENFKLYISRLKLLSSNGDEQLANVDILDWNDNSTTVTLDVTPGSYTGFAIDLGVPPSQNTGVDPSQYPNSHPLSIMQNMHWGWTAGYIFCKFDGKADTSATGNGLFDQSFVFHTGADTLLRNKCYLNYPLTITENQTTTLTFDVNVDEFFYNATDTIDLKVDNATHTSSNLGLAIRFTDLLKKAIQPQ